MKRRRLRILAILPLFVLFAFLFGWVVMSLWNALMPAIFGLKAIGYWQALGLFILAKILFGGFGGGSGARGGYWRHRMIERLERMTPEEREKFRQAFYERWGRGVPPDAKTTV